ncbi:unnamed protein product [Dimorphilus gyrociliatus]|uniref:Methyltransferase FkbM domain-containing protein n=1 Tax=Dimorphilus gyrociliatus TaxID=2664684 RepID=A0A7I8VPY7_9ANNE|nr:unnamed protein product [Dimorphilus gyrociliatus]
MMEKRDFNKLVIDVGANDGILSSNSFNFIELGWNATLIEPITSQLNIAKINHENIIDPYNDGSQKIIYVPAALTEETDGDIEMAMGRDSVQMENFRINTGIRRHGGEKVVVVNGISVGNFVKAHNIPKKFALLSVDTEGTSDKILLKFLTLGYRPSFIICEIIHNRIPAKRLVRILESKFSYKLLSQMGWNLIFEEK